MKFSRFLAVPAIVVALSTTPAMSVQAIPKKSDNTLIFAAIAAGVVALIIGNSLRESAGGVTVSSKSINGTDGKPLPGAPANAGPVLMGF